MPELEAAASVADVLPGGSDTSLVDDAPVEGVEQQDGGEVEQGGEELPQPEQQQAEPKEDEGDGRVLNPELRSHLKQLKALNPKLEKSIRGAFFALNSYKEVFPGGIQEAKQFKTELQAFGGFDGIKSIQESSAKLQEIDGKIEKGDPSVVDGMAEMLPVEAYPAIAGKFLDTFGAKDAEGYQRMMSGIIANTFDQSGVPFHLQRIRTSFSLARPMKRSNLLGEIASGRIIPRPREPEATAQASRPERREDRTERAGTQPARAETVYRDSQQRHCYVVQVSRPE
jgi:hypothetical protein